MNTTVVAQTAIAALAGLGGGLGGALIAVRYQRSSERNRQRERAAEVFAAMGPLLTELNPDRIHMNLPLIQDGQPDPMVETLQSLAERTHETRQQLSMLATWWPTAEGSDLAQRLEVALHNTVVWDGWLVHDARRGDATRSTVGKAQAIWSGASCLMNQLRAEVRGQIASPRPSPRVGCGVLWHGRPSHR